jgi:hypothetical protein
VTGGVLVMSVAGTAACGSEEAAVPAGEQAATPPQAVPPAAQPPAAAEGPEVKACYDGKCEIALSGPARIPVDGRFGFTTLTVKEITASSVSMEAAGEGTLSSVTTGPGGTVRFNELVVKVKGLGGDRAVLALRPG